MDSLPIEVVIRPGFRMRMVQFLEAINAACSTAFEQIKEKGRADVTNIDVIVSSIGQSEILFSIFANHCGRMASIQGAKDGKEKGSIFAFH